MSEYSLDAFPPSADLETVPVLRALVQAHRQLAELKGVARTIPNEGMLISTLSLQEAQSSSEIENIITTQDALYRYQIQPDQSDPVSKEVAHYAEGLLDTPILYLSRYISQTKSGYYQALQRVRNENDWEQWLL